MGVLDTLSTTMATGVFPALANAGVVETMSVSRTAQTADGMGGFTDGTVTTPYTNIPVNITEATGGDLLDLQGKPIVGVPYVLGFPMVTTTGTLISIVMATDKLLVDARSPFPARTFRIHKPSTDSNVINRFVCTEEF